MIPANTSTKIREVLTYIAADAVIVCRMDFCSYSLPFGIYLKCHLKLVYRERRYIIALVVGSSVPMDSHVDTSS